MRAPKLSQHPKAGYTLATLGVLVVVAEIALHIYGYFSKNPYELNHAVLLFGVILGFVGFYIIDPRKAEDGGGFLVRSGVDIIKALPRFGRRSTDAVAIPDAKTEVKALPVDPDDKPPTPQV
jgi:hypothetical protein